VQEKKFIILDASEVDYIDFSEVLETELGTMRFSVDGTKTFVKYLGDQPDFVFEITNDLIGRKEYSHKEFLEILEGEEWTKQYSR
jgi:hypothetical protein